MPESDAVPQSSTTPFHVGLTPERVIDAALELTRESHLFGWSIRDLARRLGVTASVVYHHVGGKDRIARGVVDRVLLGLHSPEPELDWQDWFRELLHCAYSVIAGHPGVAKWLLLHGPTFPAALPIMDAGTALLARAGFTRVGFAYGALLNNAMLTISIGDERLLHEDDGPRDHATMTEEFRRAGAGHVGPSWLAETFASLARGGEEAARQREEYYHHIIEITLAGLSATLRE